MRTTSIKETLEKHTQKPAENSLRHSALDAESPCLQEIAGQARNDGSERRIAEDSELSSERNDETIIDKSSFIEFSKECWEECVRNACKSSKIAEVLLLKVNPYPTDDYKIEFEVANEIEKNEIKQVQPSLLQNLHEKTGNQYTLDIQITKIIREKTIDKTNPDEKFIHLCKENPYLLEFKQRLNLSVS